MGKRHREKGDKESLFVEAESWQKALQAARAQRGDTAPMSGFRRDRTGHRRRSGVIPRTMPTSRLTKTEIITSIADSTELEKKNVANILDELRTLAAQELRKGNEFILPGMLKLKSVVKPATQDRPGVNPFTKQPTTIKGKPESKKIRAAALKVFKDAVQ